MSEERTVTVSFRYTRTVEETYSDVPVSEKRLLELLREHNPDQADDPAYALDRAMWDVVEMVPVLLAIVHEAGAQPQSITDDRDINDVEHDAEDLKCEECGEYSCRGECVCEACGECGCEGECQDDEAEEEDSCEVCGWVLAECVCGVEGEGDA